MHQFFNIIIIIIIIIITSNIRHILHIFSRWQIEVRLQFVELFTSVRNVYGAVWKQPNVNTFGVSHQAISSPLPPLTVSQPATFSLVIAWHSYSSGLFSFLPVFTHGKAFYLWCRIQKKSYRVRWKIGNRATGRKYTVREACVRHWRCVKTKLFACLTSIKSFSGPKKGRNPDTDACFRIFKRFTKKDYM
jgi:hypothetical protein